MAEDVKDEAMEIPAKRLRLDLNSEEVDIKLTDEIEKSTIATTSDNMDTLPSTSIELDSEQILDHEKDVHERYGSDEGDESDSNISDISGISEAAWTSSSGSMAWIQRQMMLGQNPRNILHNLIAHDVNLDGLDDLTLWELVIHILSDPPKRNRLEEFHSLGHAIELIKTRKKIMVLTGAGVSVSCGIPDFRSRDGIYARLAVDFPDLPDPQAMFDIKYFKNDQRPFFKFAKEIYPGQFEPSKAHKFIRLLETHGKLLRNYTQNIDTLEQVAGIQNVIQCHGSFAKATCMACHHKVDADDIREDIFNQVIPKCPVCKDTTDLSIMKPDIVFFGESLPEEFHQQMSEDKEECDLLIVIGSSLKVRPVALIPNSLPQEIPQILINREPLKHLNFDIELLGDCDVIISELSRRLGEGWEGLAGFCVPMTEITRDQLKTPPPLSSQSQPEENETHHESKAKNTHSDSCCESKETENIDSNNSSEDKAAISNTESNISSDLRDSDLGDFDDKSCENVERKKTEDISQNSDTIDKLEEPQSAGTSDHAADIRAMWQPKKISLAKSLEDGQYLYLPPNKYAFTGAEIYPEDDSDVGDDEFFHKRVSLSSPSSCSSLTSDGPAVEKDKNLGSGTDDEQGEKTSSQMDSNEPALEEDKSVEEWTGDGRGDKSCSAMDDNVPKENESVEDGAYDAHEENFVSKIGSNENETSCPSDDHVCCEKEIPTKEGVINTESDDGQHVNKRPASHDTHQCYNGSQHHSTDSQTQESLLQKDENC